MDLRSLKRHLSPYRIYPRRKTTINHAFCSALAPTEHYDEAKAGAALRLLGQKDLDNLACVYCGNQAQTWDHLEPLVKDSRPSGYGHTLGNLVPACRDCNSQKGNRPWRQWVESNGARKGASLVDLERYAAEFTPRPVSLSDLEANHPEEMSRFQQVWDRILELMKEADGIASRIQGAENDRATASDP